MATEIQTERGIVRVPTGTWTVDRAHSSIEFRVKHMMVSTVRGRFTEFEGTIRAAPDYHDSRVWGTIESASIDTNEPRRDEHLRSPDFFDVATYPTISFESTRVEHVEGGMLLSGRWRYASGIDAATWAGLLVPVPIDGQPVMHVVLVPANEFAVDHQSWNVLGMRGTGSKDIALTRTFVPGHRWMNWQVLQEGGRHPTCPHHGPISDAPLNAINAMSTLAPTLGVASAVAEEYREIVKKKVSPAAQKVLVEDRVAQIEAATGEATLAILRRALLDDADLILREAERAGSVSLLDRAAVRTRIAVGSRLALQTAQRLFAGLGSSVLPTGTRIERLFRDVHAMSTHMLLQPEAIGEAYGRLLLDLPLPPTARV